MSKKKNDGWVTIKTKSGKIIEVLVKPTNIPNYPKYL